MKSQFWSKAFEFVKNTSVWSGIASFFLLLLGISGAVLASLGVCIFCLIPILTFLLGLFGLSIGTLLDYNYIFLGFGVFFMLLTIFLIYRKKRYCKTCQVLEKKGNDVGSRKKK
jgi:hypothetical protein